MVSRPSAPPRSLHQTEERLVKVYEYRDRNGVLVAEKARFETGKEKRFLWRKPGVEGWPSPSGVKLSETPLYGSEELIKRPTDPVYYVEGEKAADACREAGLLAVTFGGGAASQDFGEALAPLHGRTVCLWPDNDAPGRKYMERVAAALHGQADLLLVDVILPEKGDAADYFEAGGRVEGIEHKVPAEPVAAVDVPQGHAEAIYEAADEALSRSFHLASGAVICFRAENVRKEHTGIHAQVSILAGRTVLAWDVFNVERDPERLRLANSAYKAWSPGEIDGKEWPAAAMKKALDDFCKGLWPEVVQKGKGGLMAGDPDLPPALLLLQNFIVQGGGSILFAPPGRGKSYTAMLMAVSLDAGTEALWPLPQGQARVGYINLERSRESMGRRLAAVNRALGLDPRRPLPFVNARGHTLRDVLEPAIETFKEHRVDIVFLDAISRAGYGDLTTDRSANAVMDDLNRYFGTWIALGHTPRQNGDEPHVFGSQMFDAAADLTVQLSAQTNSEELATGIGLQVIKANDTPKGQQAIHVLEWDEHGLVGVRRARPHEFPEIEAGKAMGLEETAREYLSLVGWATAGQVAEEIGKARNHVSELLNAAPWAVKKRDGHKVLFGLADLPGRGEP